MHKLWYVSNKAYCRPVKMNELQRLKPRPNFRSIIMTRHRNLHVTSCCFYKTKRCILIVQEYTYGIQHIFVSKRMINTTFQQCFCQEGDRANTQYCNTLVFKFGSKIMGIILWSCFKVYIYYISSLSFIIYSFFLLLVIIIVIKTLIAFRDIVSSLFEKEATRPSQKLHPPQFRPQNFFPPPVFSGSPPFSLTTLLDAWPKLSWQAPGFS